MTSHTMPSDDVPMWSAEAEQSLIGAVLMDNRAFDRAQIEPSHFFDARHRVIWSAIQSLVASLRPTDIITLFELLQSKAQDASAGGLAYLAQLAHCVVTTRHVDQYAEIVRDKAALRELRCTLVDGLESIYCEGPTSTKLAQIASSLSKLQRERIKTAPCHLAEIAIERTAYYEKLSDGDVVPGMPTNIASLDALLAGGFKPGKLYILAARPSVGKSSLSQHIVLTLSEAGCISLFLSQEMPRDELADRAVANLGRVDFGVIQRGNFSGDDWARVTDALDRLAKLPLHVDDQPQLTVSDIRLKSQLVPGLRVLVLDYLQLCASTRKDGNRNAEIEEISRGLKSLAKELDIAVIALSQLNRDVEKRPDKEPMLSDLRDSGSIEQDADAVIFLWPVAQHSTHSVVGCKVDKNRGGRKGRFGLHFEGGYQRWSESTVDIDHKQRALPRSRGFNDD